MTPSDGFEGERERDKSASVIERWLRRGEREKISRRPSLSGLQLESTLNEMAYWDQVSAETSQRVKHYRNCLTAIVSSFIIYSFFTGSKPTTAVYIMIGLALALQATAMAPRKISQFCLLVTVLCVANKKLEISNFNFKFPRARHIEIIRYFRHTSQGSFSAVSKANFSSKYSLE